MMKNAVVACCLSAKSESSGRFGDPTKAEYFRDWLSSAMAVDLQPVIIHDGLPESERLPGADFVEVAPSTSPYTVLEDCWPAFRDWLANSEAENVFLTDIADVLFHDDPFPLVIDSSLYVGSEKFPIGRDSWNAKTIRKFYGKAVWREMMKGPSYNSGIVGGLRAVVLDFVASLCIEIERIGGGEQAAMNVLIRRDDREIVTGAPLHTVFGKREGPGSGCVIAHK